MRRWLLGSILVILLFVSVGFNALQWTFRSMEVAEAKRVVQLYVEVQWERNGLRASVAQLETENRQLRDTISRYQGAMVQLQDAARQQGQQSRIMSLISLLLGL